jgi:hypothetical protein
MFSNNHPNPPIPCIRRTDRARIAPLPRYEGIAWAGTRRPCRAAAISRVVELCPQDSPHNFLEIDEAVVLLVEKKNKKMDADDDR